MFLFVCTIFCFSCNYYVLDYFMFPLLLSFSLYLFILFFLLSLHLDWKKKPTEALSDDFLFPMTSRLSYASSPESDLETGPESRTPSKSPHRPPPSGVLPHPHLPHHHLPGHLSDTRTGRMVKSSSDPSLAAPEDTDPSSYGGGPPPYTASPTRVVSIYLCV